MQTISTIIQILIIMLMIPVSATAAETNSNKNLETAILAGGCFWCIEADYEKLKGVIEVVSGYTGGSANKATYKLVSSGSTRHIESVKISYNPDIISYKEILKFFWTHIDPTRNDGQFCDSGSQYRPAIFYLNQSQKTIAMESKQTIIETKPFKAPIKVELIKASPFYLAEEYHQDYYKKNPLRYRYYRFTCRRDARVEALWGQ